MADKYTNHIVEGKPCKHNIKSKNIGKTFGQMTLIDTQTIEGTKQTYYKVRCNKCGAEKWMNPNTVKRGTAQCEQCGLTRRPRVSVPPGDEKGIYTSYRCMIRRCYSPKDDHYVWYGGRGITVCKEWLDDFEVFRQWAKENGWEKGLTIDRIDPDGNYEPSNCRWANKDTQGFNRASTIKVIYNGEEMSLRKLAKLLNMPSSTVYLQYSKGKTIEEIVEFAKKNY